MESKGHGNAVTQVNQSQAEGTKPLRVNHKCYTVLLSFCKKKQQKSSNDTTVVGGKKIANLSVPFLLDVFASKYNKPYNNQAKKKKNAQQ